METKNKYAHLTEKERNQKIREIRKRVAKIKPIYDNNDHYELEVARSRGELPEVDENAPLTEDDITEFESSIKSLEYEIKKDARDVKTKERVIMTKKETLKNENKELKLLRKQFIAEKKEAARLAKKKQSVQYRAEKIGLAVEDYKKIRSCRVHLPLDMSERLQKKIDVLELTKIEYIFLLVKKDLEDENCSV